MAVYLAANNHPGKLILETPFYSLQALAQKIVPIFPTRLLLRFPFNSNEYIQKVKCPVYFFHGTKDEVVPYEQAEQLFEQVPGSDKYFYTIEGGEHNDLIAYEKFRIAMEAALSK
jgi:hypothetical protein